LKAKLHKVENISNELNETIKNTSRHDMWECIGTNMVECPSFWPVNDSLSDIVISIREEIHFSIINAFKNMISDGKY